MCDQTPETVLTALKKTLDTKKLYDAAIVLSPSLLDMLDLVHLAAICIPTCEKVRARGNLYS